MGTLENTISRKYCRRRQGYGLVISSFGKSQSCGSSEYWHTALVTGGQDTHTPRKKSNRNENFAQIMKDGFAKVTKAFKKDLKKASRMEKKCKHDNDYDSS